jgi:hypothetical protein
MLPDRTSLRFRRSKPGIAFTSTGRAVFQVKIWVPDFTSLARLGAGRA